MPAAHPIAKDAISAEASATPEESPVAWRLRLLGGFELDDGQTRLQRLRTRAAMLLMARLGMAPGRDHPREELAQLLWPEADARTCRSRLRQTLSTLKAVLEPPGAPVLLSADRRVLRLAPGALWCDVPAFEAALRRGDTETARQLWAGDLLPGFYDDWVHEERQRLQALADRLDTLPAAAPTRPALQPLLPQPAASAQAAVGVAAVTTSQPYSPPSLPHHLTRLIGADQRGARLRADCLAHRLVTVLGPGGCGKTRLALEVARLLCEGAPDARAAPFERAVFVSLVGAVDASALLDRLLMALRVGTAGTALEQAIQVLGGRRLLVLLDNCEQLDDDAVATIAQLAESLPAAHWLVTSRRPLGVDGEREFQLAGLALPAADAALEAAALNPAVALFVDRARAHRPDFHLHPRNLSGLLGLVRWLEGLPLAIELAAARTRVMTPADILALLSGHTGAATTEHDGQAGLAWLSRRGTRSAADPRHASMLAVIDWSWQLLAPELQDLLRAISLLPGGAALATAATLGRPPACDSALPLTVAQQRLDELLAHSVLKTAIGQDGQLRYLPYEPVREFVLSQMPPAEARQRRRRTLDWALHWARTMPPTPPLATVRDEMPNLVAVITAASGDGDSDDAVRLVLLLQSSWGEITIPRSALDALDALLAQPALDASLAANGHALAGTFCHASGDRDGARAHLQAALARPAPDPLYRLGTLSRSARLVFRLDSDVARARQLIQQALPLAREHRRPSVEASLLSLEGHITITVDRDLARGRELVAQSAALWQQTGNAHLVNAGRYNLASGLIQNRQAEDGLREMRALADEGLALHDWDMAAGALDACGTALGQLRRWAEAVHAHRQSLQVAWDNAEMLSVIYALWDIPPALAHLRQGRLAAQTMAAAESLWRTRFGPLNTDDQRHLVRMRRLLRRLLSPADARAAWAQGAALPVGDAVRAVLAAPG